MFAGVGLYGVVAYTVSARTTELGVRMALVLWQGTAMAAIGAALGLALAFGSMRSALHDACGVGSMGSRRAPARGSGRGT